MSRLHANAASSARGASLLEALIAVAVLVTIAGGTAHLLVWSRRAIWSAGARSTAVVLAGQKIEQLRSLPWHVEGEGVRVSDDTTDLSTDPAGPTGSGLQPAPPGTLERNTPGFVDYVDDEGGWCGNGASPPQTAVFIRRWAIEPMAGDPADSIVLSVFVIPVVDARLTASARRSVRLTTVRTRTSE